MPVVGTVPRATARQRSSASSLPVELSSFVGRSVELAEVKRLLQAAHAITLIGPGGVGKTRLAVRAARKLARHFPDGVRFVELTELDSPDLVAYALARSLGVQERRGEAIRAGSAPTRCEPSRSSPPMAGCAGATATTTRTCSGRCAGAAGASPS